MVNCLKAYGPTNIKINEKTIEVNTLWKQRLIICNDQQDLISNGKIEPYMEKLQFSKQLRFLKAVYHFMQVTCI